MRDGQWSGGDGGIVSFFENCKPPEDTLFITHTRAVC